jgi:hypothetical protein
VLESDPFSASKLELVLRVVEPKPQVALIDRGYSDNEAAETKKVIAEFAKVEGIDMGTVVEITDQVFDEVGKDHL